MSEMAKRVEAAIVEELGRQRIAARSWGNSFEGVNPPVRWDAVARAAIEAMREPTLAMAQAAYRRADKIPKTEPPMWPWAYQLMIEEALKP